MLIRLLYIVGLVFTCTSSNFAQSYAFGIKLGPSLGVQRWNNYQSNDPLFKYHAVAFIETADEGSNGSIFAEAGYHIKGRAIRFRANVHPITGTPYDAQTFQMQFQNISLSAGGKKKFNLNNALAYYSLAIRVDYNIDADLQIYSGFEEGINKFTYGIDLGGGFEFPFSDFVSGLLDFRVSPDLSKQIFIPPSEWNNPYTGTQETFREQSIKNLVFEVSLGLRFLHQITYID